MPSSIPLNDSKAFFRSPAGLLLITLVLIACLRLYGAAYHSLWQDEAVCVYKAQDGFARTVEILRQENQPPLYHFTLHIWMRLFGDDPGPLRMLSFLCGFLQILLIAWTARVLFNGRTAWWALLIAAVSPALIEFSQEITPYALYWLLNSAACLCFVIGMEKSGRRTAEGGCARSSWARWTLYAVLRAASIYMHYFGLFFLMAEGLWALIQFFGRRRAFFAWCVSLAGILLFFAPWLPIFLEQRRRVAGGFWVQSMALTDPKSVILPWANMLRQWVMWFPQVQHKPWIYITPAALLLFLGLAAWAIFRGGRLLFAKKLFSTAEGESATSEAVEARGIALCLIYFLLPPVTVTVLALRGSAPFTPKYLLGSAPFFYILVAHGVGLISQNALRRTLGGVCVGLTLIGALLCVAAPDYRPPEFNRAGRQIQAAWQDGDLAVVYDSDTFAGMHYYLRALHPEIIWHCPPDYEAPFWQGLEGYDQSKITPDIAPWIASRPRIWICMRLHNSQPWAKDYVVSLREQIPEAALSDAGYRVVSHRIYLGVEVCELVADQDATHRRAPN
ncbi:glycosyltransferase family 39 protein [Candidatus Sumerlaeota bacterium]|nr:glycosyltransferase family 39 protein [Candidatus Sumerlaeota bacterium]